MTNNNNNNAFVPLANKLKLALETCEPDIFKLLSAVTECLSYLDVLLGGNTLLQTPEYEILLLSLKSIIKNGGTDMSNSNNIIHCSKGILNGMIIQQMLSPRLMIMHVKRI